MAVINSLSFKAQLLPFNTAISWQQEWEREREEKKDKFNVKKHNNVAPLGSAMT